MVNKKHIGMKARAKGEKSVKTGAKVQRVRRVQRLMQDTKGEKGWKGWCKDIKSEKDATKVQ